MLEKNKPPGGLNRGFTVRRIRRYKTFHFGSIVVEKDNISNLRSSSKVISRKIFQKCWWRDACFTMYHDINICVGPSIRLTRGGNLNIVNCREKKKKLLTTVNMAGVNPKPNSNPNPNPKPNPKTASFKKLKIDPYPEPAFSWHPFLQHIAVSRKLFDMRFSHKHCYISRGCLPDKMASKPL